MLKDLQEKGITILVSTPYMDEASLCDRVALIQNGKILSIDTPGNIVEGFGRPLFVSRADDMLKLLDDLRQLPEIEAAYPSGIYHHVVMRNGNDPKQIRDQLENKHNGLEVISIKPDIEDCFIALMH